jgi:acyl-CoA thioester hydrolase
MRREHETRVRVRYAETDQMGVVYYANYLAWMEVGRAELCRDCGFSYHAMESEDGLLLAVAEANCRYAAPARYDDEVIIRAWVEEASTRMVTFGYHMRRAADDQKLVSGFTRHIVLNRAFERARMPRRYLEMLGAV